MKRTAWMILAVLLAVTVSGTVTATTPLKTAEHNLKITVPEKVVLTLIVQEDDFGAIDEPGSYSIGEAVKVTYQYNKGLEWQLRVTATPFIDGIKALDVDVLHLLVDDGNKVDILNPVAPVVIDHSGNYDPEEKATQKTRTYGYEVVIAGDVLEGEYTSTVTYDLFIP